MKDQSCSRCILDSSFPNISFDSKGICNYCRGYDAIDKKYPLTLETEKKLDKFFLRVKKENSGSEYDCILGVSGGRDSSYTLYLLKERWGMNPLAFHCDVHMDSKTAADNIKRICSKLDVDLNTFVVDWEEFRDLQRSFFHASVPAIDAPQDHAIFGSLFSIAQKEGIKTIINGSSFRTEGKIPRLWSWPQDTRFIRDIHRKYGTIPLKKFPLLVLRDKIIQRFGGFQSIAPLNYIDYRHADVDKLLSDELGWKYYGGHHFESIFTRWSFAHYLPQKFGIDKRGTDYSALIRSGHISRDEAMKRIMKDQYSPEMEKEDRRYILNKLGFSNDEYKTIMNTLPRSIFSYRHHHPYVHYGFNYIFGPKMITCLK